MVLKPWYVVSPEYGTVMPILDDGTGPMEYGCDVVRVEAETRRDALAFGVRLMLADSSCRWVQDCRSDWMSPYAGMKVESALCPHENTTWDETCEACIQEWAR